MSDRALHGFGTLLQRGDGLVPETFTSVAEVKSISGPDMSSDTHDVTAHTDGDPWRTKIPGLLDAGQLSFDVNFLPFDPTHDSTGGLVADFAARSVRNWRLVFPDPGQTTWEMRGFVSGLSFSEPVDDILSASVTIELTGKPAFV